MAYTVMQKGLEAPTTEQLKIAFKGVPGLTALDALTLGRDAFGILGKSLDLARAEALRNSLASQGVEAAVVEDSAVPPLPEPFVLHRVACTSSALLIYDSLNRTLSLSWSDILLIAAGKVMMDEFERRLSGDKNAFSSEMLTALPLQNPRFGGRFEGARRRAGYETVEEHNERLLLEIVLKDGAKRYSINADKSPLLFQYLGERRVRDRAQNFGMLVHDLTAGAPDAVINRGVYEFRANPAKAFCYPHKNAFHHEIVWLLWQISAN